MSRATVLCVGADIKNRFLIARDQNFFLGPEIGDLDDVLHYESFKREIRQALKKSKAGPSLIACDLHPGYFSTRFAKGLSRDLAVRHVDVQHHHAHIASVLEEHGLRKPVLGVSFDGTGFGTDDKIWGGEFLLVKKHSFKRLAHLKYLKMPGAEKVVRQPWRMALSVLGKTAVPFLKGIRREDKEIVLSMMSKDTNSPLTSSAGRLFDAAAALMGLCENAAYQAQGPMELEGLCDDSIRARYDFDIGRSDGSYVVDAQGVFFGMVRDLRRGKSPCEISTKFHNSMVEIIVTMVKQLSNDTGLRDVVFSGGVFQNKFLKKWAMKKCALCGFGVFTNERLPVNDLNIAWGQYYVSGRTSQG
ncbi:MAG: hypothetical protein V1863_04305 [Candidatus Omnitrophota bacterium]